MSDEPVNRSPNFEPIEDNTPRVLSPRAHISHSQVEMYNRCSWQYYFRYVLGIKSPPNLDLAIGKGGHEALEFNAKAKIKTGSDVPLADLLDKASDLIDAQTGELEPEHLDPEDDPGRAKDAALASLTYFRLKEAPTITPIIAEYEFLIDLPATEQLEYPIRIVNGKIDVIEAEAPRPGTAPVGIRDYKFSSKRRTKTQSELDMSRQLTLYDMAFEAKTGKPAASLGYHQFLPGTSRDPAKTVTLLRDQTELAPDQRARRRDRLVNTYQMVEKAIQNGIFIQTDNPMTCSWCGYRQRCQYSLVKDDYEAARLRAREAA